MSNRYDSRPGGGAAAGSAQLNSKNVFSKNMGFTVLDKGSLSGSVTIDASESAYQRITVANDITINFTGFTNNVAMEVVLELVSPGTKTVTINGVVWQDPSFAENYVTLTSYLSAIGRADSTLRRTGKETFIFASSDGGAAILGKIA